MSWRTTWIRNQRADGHTRVKNMLTQLDQYIDDEIKRLYAERAAVKAAPNVVTADFNCYQCIEFGFDPNCPYH